MPADQTPRDPVPPAEQAAPPPEPSSVVPAGDGRSALQPLVYDGAKGTLFWLGLKITLLTGITAGVYSFWGRTRIRQYLWGHLTLFGDRISYTGTGKELFLGFLIILAVLAPVLIIFGVAEYLLLGYGQIPRIAFTTLQYLLYGYLIGYALYRARRYRLTRTIWRGIRFGQTGSAARYALMSLGWGLALILTLGLIMPIVVIRLSRYEINNTWFGDRHFEFEGNARDLFKTWLLCWLALPFTLGLSWSWFNIRTTSYVLSKARLEGLQFQLPIGLRNARPILIAIFVLNLFYIGSFALLAWIVIAGAQALPAPVLIPMALAVLGIFIFGRALQLRFVMHPFLALVADRFSTTGDANLETVLQNMTTRTGTGEGLASALDVGAGLDAGL